jgi:hypothetical protein
MESKIEQALPNGWPKCEEGAKCRQKGCDKDAVTFYRFHANKYPDAPLCEQHMNELIEHFNNHLH